MNSKKTYSPVRFNDAARSPGKKTPVFACRVLRVRTKIKAGKKMGAD
jgi:hypothetical protein